MKLSAELIHRVSQGVHGQVEADGRATDRRGAGNNHVSLRVLSMAACNHLPSRSLPRVRKHLNGWLAMAGVCIRALTVSH